MFIRFSFKKSSRWNNEEKNYVASYVQKKVPDYPISNEYWKSCAQDMNTDLGTNRTGKVVKDIKVLC